MDTNCSNLVRYPRVRGVAVFALALALAACGGTPIAQVPDPLNPGPGESLAMVVAAKGFQIYQCRARGDASGGSEWAFVAPDAELFDTGGNRIGRHGAGPYWEAADGSRVVGKVKARADAPVADAIPWLLLETRAAGPAGAFSKVTSIQRVNTVGGVAPAEACSRDAIGTTTRTAYTADYLFFTAR